MGVGEDQETGSFFMYTFMVAVELSFIGPPSLSDLTMSAATWILKIKEQYKIPQSAINSIIEDVTVLFQTYLFCIFGAVKQQLIIVMILLCHFLHYFNLMVSMVNLSRVWKQNT